MTAIPSISPGSRFSLLRAESAESDFATDVRRGLTADRKWLAPKWFYDDLGSALFDTICFLPEYYVMRAEAEVLVERAEEIVDALGFGLGSPVLSSSRAQTRDQRSSRAAGGHERDPRGAAVDAASARGMNWEAPARLVELGSGAARKTRILLDAITRRQRELEYVPVDVDEAMLERTSRDLLSEYENLRITAVRSDFSRPSIPMNLLPRLRGRTIVLFLGSTIGNLDPDAATEMLRDLRSALRPGDALLLGADLRKDPEILEPAYNDALGVTAAFNLNLLQRINRELGGQFDLSSFAHHAFYDRELGRIEMHLVSRRAQRVRVESLGLDIDFEAGETIHTESSWKHDARTLETLATASGFTVARTWTDARKWFADALLVGT